MSFVLRWAIGRESLDAWDLFADNGLVFFSNGCNKVVIIHSRRNRASVLTWWLSSGRFLVINKNLSSWFAVYMGFSPQSDIGLHVQRGRSVNRFPMEAEELRWKYGLLVASGTRSVGHDCLPRCIQEVIQCEGDEKPIWVWEKGWWDLWPDDMHDGSCGWWRMVRAGHCRNWAPRFAASGLSSCGWHRWSISERMSMRGGQCVSQKEIMDGLRGRVKGSWLRKWSIGLGDTVGETCKRVATSSMCKDDDDLCDHHHTRKQLAWMVTSPYAILEDGFVLLRSSANIG